MILRRAAAAASLCVAGCTFDYEAILDGAEQGQSTGGGARDGSTTVGATTASSSSGGAAEVASSSASSTSSAASGGGQASGGGGDASGGGGAGGDLLFTTPCDVPGLALDFEQDDVGEALGEAWVPEGKADELRLVGGALEIDIDPGEFSGIRTVEAVLFECSVTVSLLDLEPFASADSPIDFSLGTQDVRLQVLTADPDDDGGYCDILVAGEDRGDCLDSEGALDLRVRHTGTEICFDVGPPGGALEEIDCADGGAAAEVVITLRADSDATAIIDDVR